MEYLQNPDEGEGEEDGGEEGEDQGPDEPYPGEEGLDELWKEVVEMCNEEDVERLEEELKGKPPEEQWKLLLDVREYLLGVDEEERQAFEEWKPTMKELNGEWKELLKRVPQEDLVEVE